jgi:hypothetical protein
MVVQEAAATVEVTVIQMGKRIHEIPLIVINDCEGRWCHRTTTGHTCNAYISFYWTAFTDALLQAAAVTATAAADHTEAAAVVATQMAAAVATVVATAVAVVVVEDTAEEVAATACPTLAQVSSSKTGT